MGGKGRESGVNAFLIKWNRCVRRNERAVTKRHATGGTAYRLEYFYCFNSDQRCENDRVVSSHMFWPNFSYLKIVFWHIYRQIYGFVLVCSSSEGLSFSFFFFFFFFFKWNMLITWIYVYVVAFASTLNTNTNNIHIFFKFFFFWSILFYLSSFELRLIWSN